MGKVFVKIADRHYLNLQRFVLLAVAQTRAAGQKHQSLPLKAK